MLVVPLFGIPICNIKRTVLVYRGVGLPRKAGTELGANRLSYYPKSPFSVPFLEGWNPERSGGGLDFGVGKDCSHGRGAASGQNPDYC